VPRSSYYYQPRPESAENLRLLRRLDQLYLKRPFFGSRKMAVELEVNRKRIQRLMRILGIEAHYRKPNLSRPAPDHQVYPYLLRGVEILRPNHVWSTDITYLPMHGGFLYLVAVMDWFSRFVLSWELSNTSETSFCLTALNAAFRFGQPESGIPIRVRCPSSGQTGHRSLLASRRLPTVLALAVSRKSGRAAESRPRDPGVDPSHKSRKSNLGCTSHSR
jgi:transposase InsO family protein